MDYHRSYGNHVPFSLPLLYCVVSLCIVFPPRVFRTRGLTVEGIWQSFLGSEVKQFSLFHIQRVVATAITHAILLLGFCILVAREAPWILHLEQQQSWLHEAASLFVLMLGFSAFGLLALAWHWTRKDFRYNPVRKAIACYHPSNWRRTARIVDVEFEDMDRFELALGFRKVIATDTWVIQTDMYSVSIARQYDIDVSITSERYIARPNSIIGTQLLRMHITSVNPGVHSFDVWLTADKYQEFRDKLNTPIRNSRNIIIQQSLSDQFLTLFLARVDQHPHFQLDEEPDRCAGCFSTSVSAKIVKPPARDGTYCRCRPMFCLECFGKWFVSCQDQTRPDKWLDGEANCPTCRVLFLVGDVRRATHRPIL
eukprot:m.163499 g.163499  ORF g.163499 m.163499 type:complete len:368 (-) comp14388_c0_seq2:1336-2439(-)